MAKQIKVREDNYFAVQGWMVTELKLKGNALMLYAIIYGFSQTTNTAFTGSVDYLCEWLGGVSRPTVINTLDNLVKQGLLTKSSTTKGALIYNSYTALRPSKKILSDEDPTSKKTLPDTSKNFLLNKDSKDNIEKSISKEMEGKAPKKRSYSTILEDPVNKFVKEALSKFIQYCRGKNYTPKVTTVEKFASTLRDNAGEDPVVALAIVDQSIDKGWKDLYPLKAGCDLMAGRIIGAQSEAFKTKYAPVFGEEAPVEVVEEKQEEPQEKAYTVEEVAQILGCSERNVYRNIQSGKLEAVEREVMIPTLKKFVTEEALEKYKAGRAS